MTKKAEDEVNKEVETKEEKKKAREERAEKRKQAKKQDKLARWSGLIMLLILMMMGFLLWVGGEVGVETGVKRPGGSQSSTQPRIIIE